MRIAIAQNDVQQLFFGWAPYFYATKYKHLSWKFQG